jgi:hypothetical protein
MSQSGIRRSGLGKLLVAGSVKAVYARAKLAKAATKRQVWDQDRSKEGNSMQVLRNAAFLRVTAHDHSPIPLFFVMLLLLEAGTDLRPVPDWSRTPRSKRRLFGLSRSVQILDIDYPGRGFIHLNSYDSYSIVLRDSMK